MKISKIETFIIAPRWHFIRIETDEGLVGWGEPIVEGRALTMQAAVEDIKELLIGRDPLMIEDTWQLLYRTGMYRGGPVLMSLIAGIDQALWDIKGKYYNAPVYDLLGGPVRENIDIYTWVGGDRPRNTVEEALAAKNNGFKAIKMNATSEMHYIDSLKKVDDAIARVAEMREAVGPHFGIALDFHGRVHKAMAKILVKELEEYRPMFIEEPVLPEHLDYLGEIARHSNIPLATGERMYSRWDFKKILNDGYIDIIQPDLSHAGGITECKKIFNMAEAYDVAVAPHCPLGPIALAACLQVDAIAHNAIIQEQSMGIHYNESADLLDYIDNKEDFQFENGAIGLLKKPGLGVEINEEFVREKAIEGHNWKFPVWRNTDGTISEW